jgi:hypothetical protein
MASDSEQQRPGDDLKVVTICRGIRQGDIVFIESSRPVFAQAMDRIYAEFKRRCPTITVVLLEEGLRVATVWPAETWPAGVRSGRRFGESLSDDELAAIIDTGGVYALAGDVARIAAELLARRAPDRQAPGKPVHTIDCKCPACGHEFFARASAP